MRRYNSYIALKRRRHSLTARSLGIAVLAGVFWWLLLIGEGEDVSLPEPEAGESETAVELVPNASDPLLDEPSEPTVLRPPKKNAPPMTLRTGMTESRYDRGPGRPERVGIYAAAGGEADILSDDAGLRLLVF